MLNGFHCSLSPKLGAFQIQNRAAINNMPSVQSQSNTSKAQPMSSNMLRAVEEQKSILKDVSSGWKHKSLVHWLYWTRLDEAHVYIKAPKLGWCV